MDAYGLKAEAPTRLFHKWEQLSSHPTRCFVEFTALDSFSSA